MPIAPTFPCSSCGAELEFAPGTTNLRCPHCGSENAIPASAETVEELDYEQTLRDLAERQDEVDQISVHCDSCSANITLDPGVTSQACPFCGSNIVAAGQSRRLIRPRSLLPFEVPPEQARARFAAWLKGLWFAPNDLKRIASIEGMRLAAGSSSAAAGATGLIGVYLPYWTFDARCVTPYTGQRGDDYWETVGFGKNARRVRRTRWSFASGTVHNAFDDILTPGSNTLPQELVSRLGRWDLKSLVPYDDRFVSGFRSESYAIELPAAFANARTLMIEEIRSTIRSDIGGDHQRISSMSPQFSAITFKHVLLPLWISTFRYKGKLYRFLVNARTGQLSGERPYSAAKISLLVLSILAAIAIIVVIATRN